MSKCEAWHIRGGRLPKELTYECWGTRERDACSCGGDQMKCDFYVEIRERAKRERQIEAAIAYYETGIKEDIFSPEVATYAGLAIDGLRDKLYLSRKMRYKRNSFC